MTIDEAITELRSAINGWAPDFHPRLQGAIKLGTEALRRVKSGRKRGSVILADSLPGETKE